MTATDPDRADPDRADEEGADPEHAVSSIDEALDRFATVIAQADTARVEAQIPPLVELLGQHGIAVIVLKGPVTRRRLYAADERRPVADIDALVDPGAFGRAGRVLRRAGYRRYDRHGHSDAYTREVNGDVDDDADVDLHLTLPYVQRAPKRAFATFAAHTTTLDVAGSPVPVLDEPAHVVHLAIHAAVNRFDAGQRSFMEWERGLASLSDAQQRVAETIATTLGVAPVWHLAVEALADAADRVGLAAAVPTWEAEPRMASVRGFMRSGTPLWVKWRDFQRLVALQWSDGAVNEWRAKRGAAPLPPGGASIVVQKCTRLIVVTVAGAGRLVGIRRGAADPPEKG